MPAATTTSSTRSPRPTITAWPASSQSTAYKEYPAVPPEVVAALRCQGPGRDQGEDGRGRRLPQGRVDPLVRLGSPPTNRPVHARGLDVSSNKRKAKPDLSTAEFAKGEGLEASSSTAGSSILEPKADDKRPYLARWRKLVAGQDAKLDLSGDEAAKAEAGKVAHRVRRLHPDDAGPPRCPRGPEVAALANAAEGSPPSPPVLGGPEADVVRELTRGTTASSPCPRNQVEKHLAAEAKAALKAKRAELEKLKKDAPAKYPVVHSLAEGANPANMKVFLRGNPATPGPEARRGFLSVLAPEGSAAFSTKGSGRLELARAIASPEPIP